MAVGERCPALLLRRHCTQTFNRMTRRASSPVDLLFLRPIKTVHFADEKNADGSSTRNKNDQDKSDLEQDRELENSLQSGKMSEEELMQECLTLSGWFDPTMEVTPYCADFETNSNSQGTSGVFSWNGCFSSSLSSASSSNSHNTQKFSTRAPSVSSMVAGLHLGLSYTDRKDSFLGKKSSILRSDSIVLNSNTNAGVLHRKDTFAFSHRRQQDVLEDAFLGIMHEDHLSIDQDEPIDVDESPDARKASCENFWNDVQF